MDNILHTPSFTKMAQQKRKGTKKKEGECEHLCLDWFEV